MTRPEAPIRLGIIGCGRVAEERHLPSLLSLPQFRVEATADPDPVRCERLARSFGASLRLSDYRELLACHDIDAVAVLTPTSSHAEIGIAAVEAGKHVLVEKPLALTVADCDRFIAAAKEARCKVLVGLNLRWHRLIERARRFLATGALGRIKALRSVYTHDRTGKGAPEWHGKLSLGGGVCLNEAVHHFDLWNYMGAGEIDRVFSFHESSAFYDDETNVVAAHMTGGAMATGIFSFRTGPVSELEIYGELGRLCISLYRFDGMEFFPNSRYPGELKGRLRSALSTIADLPQVASTQRQGGDFQATFWKMWRHFGDCILKNTAPRCTLWDGRDALQVALAVIQSADSGQPVPLYHSEGR